MLRFYETGKRLTKADREALKAKGLYVYARRDNGREETIEPSVAVDFMGTLVTDFEIGFDTEGPSAYVIYDGNAYLKSVGATRVYNINELIG